MSVTVPQGKGSWGSIFYCFMHNCTVLAVALESYMVWELSESFFLSPFPRRIEFWSCGIHCSLHWAGEAPRQPYHERLAHTHCEQRALCVSSTPGNLGKENGRMVGFIQAWSSEQAHLVCWGPPGLAWPLHPWEISSGTFSSGKWLNSKGIQQRLGYKTSKCI